MGAQIEGQNRGPDKGNDFQRLIVRAAATGGRRTCSVKDVCSMLRLYRMQATRRPHVTHSPAERQAIIDRMTKWHTTRLLSETCIR